MRLHTGDTVFVITGKDRGKTGKVLRVLHDDGRVVVGGVNMRVKHIRKTPQQAGQKVRYEASIHVSNVMLVDPKTKKGTRIRYVLNTKGHKERVAKKSGEALQRGGKGVRAAESGKGGEKLPGKVPFWKKLGFGGEGGKKEGDSSEERTDVREVSGEGTLQSSRSHGRGS